MMCAPRVVAARIGLLLVVGCGRTHLLDNASGGSAALVDEPGAGHGSGSFAGRNGAADSGGMSAIAAGSSTRALDTDHAGSAARSGAGGYAGHAGRVDAGAHAGSGAAGRTPANAATTSDAGAANVPANIPQLPLGITVDATATLPEGLWVGETGSEDACAVGGGGVIPGSSRQVTIEITAAAAGAPPQGIVVFGDKQVLPPVATDPDVGYPVPDDALDSLCRQNHASAGYPYAVRDGHVAPDGRVEFRVSVVELYAEWCALQTSYLVGRASGGTANGYTCNPPLGGDDLFLCWMTPEQCPIPSTKFETCNGSDTTCVCYQDGCYANLNRAYRFRLQVMGQTMVGLLNPPNSDTWPAIEIKLHRVR
jgi:hypothetical protein